MATMFYGVGEKIETTFLKTKIYFLKHRTIVFLRQWDWTPQMLHLSGLEIQVPPLSKETGLLTTVRGLLFRSENLISYIFSLFCFLTHLLCTTSGIQFITSRAYTCNITYENCLAKIGFKHGSVLRNKIFGANNAAPLDYDASKQISWNKFPHLDSLLVCE